MIKILSILLILVLMISFASCQKVKSPYSGNINNGEYYEYNTDETPYETEANTVIDHGEYKPMEFESNGTGKFPKVKMTIKNYGEIELKLNDEQAPITVANFVKLVEDGFYDGLTFHRIIQGFMIQGGDPLGDGTGGSDKDIKGEFASNGVQNNISHLRGVISMARSQDPDSASSQFFICDADSTFLDGQYAAFGVVTKGIEVVDQTAADAVPVDDNGTILPENQPVIEKIEMIK